MHDPPTHTPAPEAVVQAVLSALLPVAVQTAFPPEHTVVPFKHGLSVSHPCPEMHVVHAPFRQYRFVPQLVPFGWVAVSVHVGPDGPHLVAPVLHRFVGWHAWPSTHTGLWTQVPF